MTNPNPTIASIILAAGEGTRMKSNSINKTALKYNKKPMIQYAVEAVNDISDQIVIVVGAYANSVKQALKGQPDILYSTQRHRQGTGHATQIGLNALSKHAVQPDIILVGYGDHMMFYKPTIIQALIQEHLEQQSAITLLTTQHSNANELAWGRIIRDQQNMITKIVEQKDATDFEKKINEINPGFYCFDYQFLKHNIGQLTPSPVTGELYLTDMVDIGCSQGKKVCGHNVPFEYVGIGVNSPEQLQQSQLLHQQLHHA